MKVANHSVTYLSTAQRAGLAFFDDVAALGINVEDEFLLSGADTNRFGCGIDGSDTALKLDGSLYQPI